MRHKKNIDKLFEEKLREVPVMPSAGANERLAQTMGWQQLRYYQRVRFWVAALALSLTAFLIADTPWASSSPSFETALDLPQHSPSEQAIGDVPPPTPLPSELPPAAIEEMPAAQTDHTPTEVREKKAHPTNATANSLDATLPARDEVSSSGTVANAPPAIEEANREEGTSETNIVSPDDEPSLTAAERVGLPDITLQGASIPSPEEVAARQRKKKSRRIKVVINLKPQDWPQTAPERKPLIQGFFDGLKKIPIKNN
jgi:hypothetical protein